MANKMIRGTTPTIRYTFKDILPGDINLLRLVIKQGNDAVITREEDTATFGENYVEWTLTQKETFLLDPQTNASICLDWLLEDGTRGVGKTCNTLVGSSAVDEVLE